jgi:hypothetical protein
VHPGLREPMDGFRQKIFELYEAMQRFATFSLPETDPERVEKLRSWVRWEDIRSRAASPSTLATTGRGWMRSEELAELEALEARLAEELRSRGPGETTVDFVS